MKKILFINSEITPYVPETELALKGKLVPKQIQEHGSEIRTFMPKWGTINERRGQLHEVIRLSGLNIEINDIDHPTIIKVASIPQTKIQVYFIDSEDYFIKRGMATDEEGNIYKDNGRRAIFFARAVIETIKKLRWTPDVIHCQGWMAGLVPFYVKKAYYDEPAVCNAKVVTSLFGNDDQAPVCDEAMKLCLEYRDITTESLSDYNEPFTGTDMARIAIENSDGVIEATPNVSDTVKQLVANAGVKSLAYSGEDIAEAYANFYETL